MIGYHLSQTGLARHPLYIRRIGINLWSVEELCYYVYTWPALLDEDILSLRLTRWLTEEFNLTGTSIRMEQGLKKGESLADFLMPLFQDTGYLDAVSLRSFSRELAALSEASRAVRLKKMGDALVDNGRFGEAEAVYRRAEEAGEKDPAFRAAVLHNCGAAAARLMEYEEAKRLFLMAVRLNPKPRYLRSLLAAMRLSMPEERYLEEAAAFTDDDALILEVQEETESMRREVERVIPEEEPDLGLLRKDYHRASGT